MTENSETLGQRIRKYRKYNGLTMKELGAKLNLSEQAISQYERNKRTPSIDTLNKIAIILDIPLSEFITNMNPIENINKTYYDSLSDDEFKQHLKKSFDKYSFDYSSEINKELIIQYLSRINPMTMKLNNYINNFDTFSKEDLINFYNDFFDYATLVLKTFIENEYNPKINELNKKLKNSCKLIKEQQELIDSYTEGIKLLNNLSKKILSKDK